MHLKLCHSYPIIICINMHSIAVILVEYFKVCRNFKFLLRWMNGWVLIIPYWSVWRMLHCLHLKLIQWDAVHRHFLKQKKNPSKLHYYWQSHQHKHYYLCVQASARPMIADRLYLPKFDRQKSFCSFLMIISFITMIRCSENKIRQQGHYHIQPLHQHSL